MLTSMAPQEDDPLAFLNLDIRMPSVHNWGSGDQNSNRCEPLHATATVRAAGSIAHLATGHAVLIPPCPVGSGGTRRRGDLTQDRGGRGWIICIASRRRSRMYSQMILLG
jgi:hypothetical protein